MDNPYKVQTTCEKEWSQYDMMRYHWIGVAIAHGGNGILMLLTDFVPNAGNSFVTMCVSLFVAYLFRSR